jgi:hypothetical protein
MLTRASNGSSLTLTKLALIRRERSERSGAAPSYAASVNVELQAEEVIIAEMGEDAAA